MGASNDRGDLFDALSGKIRISLNFHEEFGENQVADFDHGAGGTGFAEECGMRTADALPWSAGCDILALHVCTPLQFITQGGSR
jgi:hypothetical protein